MILKAVKYIFVFLSFILISAHFLRAGIPALSFLFISLPIFLFIRHPASIFIIRIGLLVGVAIYIETAYRIITARIKLGLTYEKAAIIMAGVVGFLLLTVVLTFKKEKQNQL